MYQTIIFDLDGTLLNTLDDLKDAVNDILQKYGYPERNMDEIRNFVGNGLKLLMERALPYSVNQEQFDKIFGEFKDYYLTHCNIKTKPYPGILKLLRQLKEIEYKLAIVSNKADGAVNELAELHFSKIFDYCVGEREGVRRKPNPDSVLQVLNELKTDNSKALYVGDSEIDFETAKRSSLNCILVSWGFRNKEILYKFSPLGIIDEPEELFYYLNLQS